MAVVLCFYLFVLSVEVLAKEIRKIKIIKGIIMQMTQLKFLLSNSDDFYKVSGVQSNDKKSSLDWTETWEQRNITSLEEL